MPSRVPPQAQESLRVPTFRFPPHRPLSLPPFIYLGTCLCLVLVDSKFQFEHGETEDRHTTYNGPSLSYCPFPHFLAGFVPRSLCRCASLR